MPPKKRRAAGTDEIISELIADVSDLLNSKMNRLTHDNATDTALNIFRVFTKFTDRMNNTEIRNLITEFLEAYDRKFIPSQRDLTIGEYMTALVTNLVVLTLYRDDESGAADADADGDILMTDSSELRKTIEHELSIALGLWTTGDDEEATHVYFEPFDPGTVDDAAPRKLRRITLDDVDAETASQQRFERFSPTLNNLALKLAARQTGGFVTYNRDRTMESGGLKPVKEYGIGTLTHYQKNVVEAAKRMARNPNATRLPRSLLLFHEVGSGKTAAMWAIAAAFWKNGPKPTDKHLYQRAFFLATKQKLAKYHQLDKDSWAFFNYAPESYFSIREQAQDGVGNTRYFFSEKSRQKNKRWMGFTPVPLIDISSRDQTRTKTYAQLINMVHGKGKPGLALYSAALDSYQTEFKNDDDFKITNYGFKALFTANGPQELKPEEIIDNLTHMGHTPETPAKIPYFDPLRDAVIIIDEADALFRNTGNIEKVPRDRIESFERLVFKSYEMSGPRSVRLILATATPAHTTIEDAFRLINLLIPEEKYRVNNVGSAGPDSRDWSESPTMQDVLGELPWDGNTTQMANYIKRLRSGVSYVSVSNDTDRFPKVSRSEVLVKKIEQPKTDSQDQNLPEVNVALAAFLAKRFESIQASNELEVLRKERNQRDEARGGQAALDARERERERERVQQENAEKLREAQKSARATRARARSRGTSEAQSRDAARAARSALAAAAAMAAKADDNDEDWTGDATGGEEKEGTIDQDADKMFELSIFIERRLFNMALELRNFSNINIKTLLPEFVLGTPEHASKNGRKQLAKVIKEGRAPKFGALLDKIARIDNQAYAAFRGAGYTDQEALDRLPKHIIISDTSGRRGAPLIASCLEMAGYVWRPIARERGNGTGAPDSDEEVDEEDLDPDATPVDAKTKRKMTFREPRYRGEKYAEWNELKGNAPVSTLDPSLMAPYRNSTFTVLDEGMLHFEREKDFIPLPKPSNRSRTDYVIVSKTELNALKDKLFAEIEGFNQTHFDNLKDAAGKVLYWPRREKELKRRFSRVKNPQIFRQIDENPKTLFTKQHFNDGQGVDFLEEIGVADYLDRKPFKNIDKLREIGIARWKPSLASSEVTNAEKRLQNMFNDVKGHDLNKFGRFARIVVLSPAFATGTELFNVQHIHLFDSLEKSDLRTGKIYSRNRVQAEGRGRRNSGNSQLNAMRTDEYLAALEQYRNGGLDDDTKRQLEARLGFDVMPPLNVYEYRYDRTVAANIITTKSDIVNNLFLTREYGAGDVRSVALPDVPDDLTVDDVIEMLKNDPFKQQALRMIARRLKNTAFDLSLNKHLTNDEAPIYTGYVYIGNSSSADRNRIPLYRPVDWTSQRYWPNSFVDMQGTMIPDVEGLTLRQLWDLRLVMRDENRGRWLDVPDPEHRAIEQATLDELGADLEELQTLAFGVPSDALPKDIIKTTYAKRRWLRRQDGWKLRADEIASVLQLLRVKTLPIRALVMWLSAGVRFVRSKAQFEIVNSQTTIRTDRYNMLGELELGRVGLTQAWLKHRDDRDPKWTMFDYAKQMTGIDDDQVASLFKDAETTESLMRLATRSGPVSGRAMIQACQTLILYWKIPPNHVISAIEKTYPVLNNNLAVTFISSAIELIYGSLLFDSGIANDLVRTVKYVFENPAANVIEQNRISAVTLRLAAELINPGAEQEDLFNRVATNLVNSIEADNLSAPTAIYTKLLNLGTNTGFAKRYSVIAHFMRLLYIFKRWTIDPETQIVQAFTFAVAKDPAISNWVSGQVKKYRTGRITAAEPITEQEVISALINSDGSRGFAEQKIRLLVRTKRTKTGVLLTRHKPVYCSYRKYKSDIFRGVSFFTVDATPEENETPLLEFTEGMKTMLAHTAKKFSLGAALLNIGDAARFFDNGFDNLVLEIVRLLLARALPGIDDRTLEHLSDYLTPRLKGVMAVDNFTQELLTLGDLFGKPGTRELRALPWNEIQQEIDVLSESRLITLLLEEIQKTFSKFTRASVLDFARKASTARTRQAILTQAQTLYARFIREANLDDRNMAFLVLGIADAFKENDANVNSDIETLGKIVQNINAARPDASAISDEVGKQALIGMLRAKGMHLPETNLQLAVFESQTSGDETFVAEFIQKTDLWKGRGRRAAFDRAEQNRRDLARRDAAAAEQIRADEAMSGGETGSNSNSDSDIDSDSDSDSSSYFNLPSKRQVISIASPARFAGRLIDPIAFDLLAWAFDPKTRSLQPVRGLLALGPDNGLVDIAQTPIRVRW